MARLQKADSERELERPKTFDERMGFKPGKNTGLKKDLVRRRTEKENEGESAPVGAHRVLSGNLAGLAWV